MPLFPIPPVLLSSPVIPSDNAPPRTPCQGGNVNKNGSERNPPITGSAEGGSISAIDQVLVSAIPHRCRLSVDAGEREGVPGCPSGPRPTQPHHGSDASGPGGLLMAGQSFSQLLGPGWPGTCRLHPWERQPSGARSWGGGEGGCYSSRRAWAASSGCFYISESHVPKPHKP